MPKYRKLSARVLESFSFNDLPSDFAKLLWVLLPLVMSREGTFPAYPMLVISRVFPMRRDVSEDQVQQALDCYAEHDMIRYYEAYGRAYFWMPNWSTYQGDCSREAESPYPPVPENVVNGSRLSRDQLTNGSRSVFSIQMQYANTTTSPQNGGDGDDHGETETPLPFDDDGDDDPPDDDPPPAKPSVTVQFDTPGSKALHARLSANALALGRNPPKRFGSLEQKAAWLKIEDNLPLDELDKAIEQALERGVTALPRLVPYLEKVSNQKGKVKTDPQLDHTVAKLEELFARGVS